MTTALTGTKIKNTYGDVLQLGNSGAGVTSSLQTVRDGLGNATALQLSTVSASIGAIATFNAAVPTSGANSFLDILGTLPTTPVAALTGVSMLVVSAGSQSFQIIGVQLGLLGVYNGSSTTQGVAFSNSAAGTGTGIVTGSQNSGLFGTCAGTTTGTNICGRFNAQGGNINVGVLSRTIAAKNSAVNVSVMGVALNTGSSPVQVGGYFALRSTDPTITVSCALYADNVATTSSIFVAADNGTAVFTIADGGGVTATQSIQALGLAATGDNSGIAATTGLTNVVNTTLTNAYIVKGGQAATTVNTGWMKVYIGTVASWVPYWSNATP